VFARCVGEQGEYIFRQVLPYKLHAYRKMGMRGRKAREGRERERDLYFSAGTGTHYGTKTLPGQPTNPCAGDLTRGDVIYNMVYRCGL